MDAIRQHTADGLTWLWDYLRPDMPGAIALIIAVLTLIILICIGTHMVRAERTAAHQSGADLQEGMVGGSGLGAQYPGPSGLYPVSPTMLLYSHPDSVGRPLTPTPPTSPLAHDPSLGPPVVENVPFDAQWLTSRAGWAYGPMSGQDGIVGIGDPPTATLSTG